MGKVQDLLRTLPSVSSLLEQEDVAEWLHRLPRRSVVAAIQAAIDETRERMVAGGLTEPAAVTEIRSRVEILLRRRATPSLRRVINATGIVLHTGLGRAPLSSAAIEAIVEGASGYCNLELDLAQGGRGRRTTHVERLLTELTGAEAATVVNNNAAATLLLLQTFAKDREVVVSRGQLVEIGGSFRLPDIMAASGAKLREVGTTNRTRLEDFRKAIVPGTTGMVMHVHPSNYRIVGFSEEASLVDLATLAHSRQVLFADDLGSGALVDLSVYGLPAEPLVRDSIAVGADLVCCSGDKLLGGPQCGIIVGKKELIDRIEANPLMRTYRLDKLVLLALEATLRGYREVQDAASEIPVLSMLSSLTDELSERAKQLAERLHASMPQEHFFVCSDVSYAGGGALPAQELPTIVVQWRPSRGSVDKMMASLRQAPTPIIARIREGAICLDMRTIRQWDLEGLVDGVIDAAGAESRNS